MDISVNVSRAAAYLDHFHPGWFYQIDLDRFSIMDGCNCVLGQVFGLSYEIGQTWVDKMNVLFGKNYCMLQDPAKSPLGFASGVFVAPHYQDEWVFVIRNRQKEAVRTHTPHPTADAVARIAEDQLVLTPRV